MAQYDNRYGGNYRRDNYRRDNYRNDYSDRRDDRTFLERKFRFRPNESLNAFILTGTPQGECRPIPKSDPNQPDGWSARIKRVETYQPTFSEAITNEYTFDITTFKQEVADKIDEAYRHKDAVRIEGVIRSREFTTKDGQVVNSPIIVPRQVGIIPQNAPRYAQNRSNGGEGRDFAPRAPRGPEREPAPAPAEDPAYAWQDDLDEVSAPTYRR